MAVDPCFEDFQHEEVALCPNDEIQAGLSEGNIYYAPEEFVDTLTLPASLPTDDYEAVATISAAITCITGKGFQKLKCQVDMNELKSNLVGNKGNKKHASELELFLPGLRAKLLGFSKKMKNVPGVYVVQDNNGKKWVFGTKVSPARIDNFELTTGKKQEDDNGATVKLMANTIIYEYTGAALPLQP